MFRVLVSISLLLTGILLACENNSGEIQRVTHFENAPDEYTENLNMFHNDSGLTKVNLYAKVSQTFYEHFRPWRTYLSLFMWKSLS